MPPRTLLLLLSTILLLGCFSTEIADPDFWWHLKTGQYIVERRALPVPDPFAYTTAMARPAYPTEARTRNFNLTHEWLAQVLMYGIYQAAGFGGIVLARAFALTAFCGFTGLAAYQRRRNFLPALAAAFAAAAVARLFTADRPYQFTFLFLALTLVLVEKRQFVWLLPLLFLIWANCHAGYFLGWIVLGAYSAEALVHRLRRQTPPGSARLWLVSALCVLVCGLNPNGFHVFQVLLDYRASFLQGKLLEWSRPHLWPPQVFSVLLFATVAVLGWARREVRPADWLIFAAFSAAALAAQRNIILIAVVAPVLIATYLPSCVPWKLHVPVLGEFALALLVAGGVATGIATGRFFQLRAAEWRFPVGAADFLLANHIQQPLFNTYEYGGYLIWRLWPQERVFIDGRALSESVFIDYARILYNHDESGGPSAGQLLDRYGVQVIVMNSFEYTTGPLYLLAPALADPGQTTWKLVYNDPQAMVFMRHPPLGMQPLNPLEVLSHMEDECGLHMAHEPRYPRCARALGQVFSKLGDFARARRWIGEYLSHPHEPDPEAEEAYRQMAR